MSVPPDSKIFLTRDEVIALTGYRQAAKQVAHLRAQRIPFHLNRAGQPVVVRAIMEGAKRQPERVSWSPVWAENQL